MTTGTSSTGGVSRRTFLRGAAVAAGAAAFGPFDALAGRTAQVTVAKLPFSLDYGPLFLTRPLLAAHA